MRGKRQKEIKRKKNKRDNSEKIERKLEVQENRSKKMNLNNVDVLS